MADAELALGPRPLVLKHHFRRHQLVNLGLAKAALRVRNSVCTPFTRHGNAADRTVFDWFVNSCTSKVDFLLCKRYIGLFYPMTMES